MGKLGTSLGVAVCGLFSFWGQAGYWQLLLLRSYSGKHWVQERPCLAASRTWDRADPPLPNSNPPGWPEWWDVHSISRTSFFNSLCLTIFLTKSLYLRSVSMLFISTDKAPGSKMLLELILFINSRSNLKIYQPDILETSFQAQVWKPLFSFMLVLCKYLSVFPSNSVSTSPRILSSCFYHLSFSVHSTVKSWIPSMDHGDHRP